jgi:hypothetical protein
VTVTPNAVVQVTAATFVMIVPQAVAADADLAAARLSPAATASAVRAPPEIRRSLFIYKTVAVKQTREDCPGPSAFVTQRSSSGPAWPFGG